MTNLYLDNGLSEDEPCESASNGTEHDGATVYVVAANYADDPHPHIEGVYTNEEATEEHEEKLQDDPFGPVAWQVIKMDIQSNGPYTQKCGYCGNEFTQKLGDRLCPCPQCRSTKRADA